MKNQAFIIAREGFRWIGFAFFLSAFFYLIHWKIISGFLGILALFFAFFFRNPKRVSPTQPGLIISPADGKICMITEAFEKRFLKEPRKRISIFMSVFNCHINRSPITGRILNTHYHPGKFHVASVDKASDLNEQQTLLLEDDEKHQFVLVQIAGFVARRIVSYVKPGEAIGRGEKIGLIQFGSRVDLYLPQHTTLMVHMGQTVCGGQTVIGKTH